MMFSIRDLSNLSKFIDNHWFVW